MKRALLIALLFACAHAPTPKPWSLEEKLNFAGRCTILNMASGNAVTPSKFYCKCLADSVEALRPESWLHVEDTEEDKVMWRVEGAKCTAKLYEAFPDQRPLDQKPPAETPDT